MRVLPLLVQSLVLLVFASSAATAAKKKERAPDYQCRGIASNHEPIAFADVVLVGSGPGGAGFLHRLVRRRPDLSVLWIEKGSDFVARNWPEDITAVNGEVLTAFPRKTMTWITGYGWNNFGGGDAANSGGANYLVTEEPYDAVDVFSLRNHSIIPPTDTSERWVKAFEKSEYERVPPQPVKLDQENLVSQPSSLRTEDGRERLILADDLHYSTKDRKVTYVHARAASVIRDEVGRAVGIRGVRMDGSQNEYGGCVAWAASKAVVLAGGIFNSFDLLVESGIGPEKYLKVRDVPQDWWMPNEQVGKGLGDEHAVVFVSAEPGKADPFGAQPRLIAEDTLGSAYEFWTKGLLDWFAFKNTKTTSLLGKISKYLPNSYNLLGFFLDGCSMWAVGIDGGEPQIELEAIPKPRNTTSLPFYPPAVERYMMYPFQSPIALVKESFLYKKNPVGIIVDDSKITVSDQMCEAITNAMIPMYEGGKLQNRVKADLGTNVRRFKLWIATKLRITKLLKPNLATLHNAKKFTGRGKDKDKKCSTKMFASYYHYFGGNANVVDASYQVQGVGGLYISDGSVLARLTPGPSSATIMQTGMRVADAFVDSLSDNNAGE